MIKYIKCEKCGIQRNQEEAELCPICTVGMERAEHRVKKSVEIDKKSFVVRIEENKMRTDYTLIPCHKCGQETPRSKSFRPDKVTCFLCKEKRRKEYSKNRLEQKRKLASTCQK